MQLRLGITKIIYMNLSNNNMTAKGRKQLDITLEPWGYQDQLMGTIGCGYMEASHKSNSSANKNNNYLRNNQIRPQIPIKSRTPQIKHYEFSHNKPQRVDFLKKNQQSLKSQSLLTGNYAEGLMDQTNAFFPLGIKGPIATFYRKTAMNTMCIGYYDKNPLDVNENCHKKSIQSRKKSSITPRPRTSDFKTHHNRILSHSTHNSPTKHNVENYSSGEDMCNNMHSTNNRLQKMLKIKQKLRLKLKKNSERKDIDRGLNSKRTMKIQDFENGQNHDFGIEQPRKRQLMRNFSKKRGSEWEQKRIKLGLSIKNASRQSSRQKSDRFFVVLGREQGQK